MVWEAMSANGPWPTVRWNGPINPSKYIDMFSKHFLCNFALNLGNNSIFMQDVFINTAGNVKRFLEEH